MKSEGRAIKVKRLTEPILFKWKDRNGRRSALAHLFLLFVKMQTVLAGVRRAVAPQVALLRRAASGAASMKPEEMNAYWMPFTANRQFKAAPRLLVSAKDMHYTTADGRQVLDGTAGLWCVNAGHCRPAIVEAIQKQAAELDYAPSFQMGHPNAFALANKLTEILPGDIKHVFFTNSGSEAVDTALKMALAYHRVRGEGTRTRLIGRERGYHGVGTALLLCS
jgi:beta-alanine--pyruvate transaminase